MKVGKVELEVFFSFDYSFDVVNVSALLDLFDFALFISNDAVGVRVL